MGVLPWQGRVRSSTRNETELASVDYSLEVVDGCKGSPSVGASLELIEGKRLPGVEALRP